jgi:hypothetical protein
VSPVVIDTDVASAILKRVSLLASHGSSSDGNSSSRS